MPKRRLEALGPLSAYAVQERSSAAATAVEVRAAREQLQYAAVVDGQCIREVWQGASDVLCLVVGDGAEEQWALWHQCPEALDEGRSREVYLLQMEGEEKFMVVKLEKESEAQRQSHMERVFLVDLQRRIGRMPGWIASCYWAGLLQFEGRLRDATIWEYVQPTFGAIVQELTLEWHVGVAAALFVGCFAIAREVVDGLRDGIFYGDLHMHNLALRVSLETFVHRASTGVRCAGELGICAIDLGMCVTWAGDDKRVCEEVVLRSMGDMLVHVLMAPSSVALALGQEAEGSVAYRMGAAVGGALLRLLPLEAAQRGGLNFVAGGLEVLERSTKVLLAGGTQQDVDAVEREWLERLPSWGQVKAAALEPLSEAMDAVVGNAVSVVASVAAPLIGRRVVEKLKECRRAPPVQAGQTGFAGRPHRVPPQNRVCLDMAWLIIESLLAALRSFVRPEMRSRSWRQAPVDAEVFARGTGMAVRLALGVLEQAELDQAHYPVLLDEALGVFTVERVRAVLVEELEVLQGLRPPPRTDLRMKRDFGQYWFRFRTEAQQDACLVKALMFFQRGCQAALEGGSSRAGGTA